MRIWNSISKRYDDVSDEEFRSGLKKCLSYDPVTGFWHWLVKYRSANIGDRADRIGAKGYRYVSYRGETYKSSNLAYFYMIGEWPKEIVDHRNLIRSDDNWENLRPASCPQNNANRPISKRNSSGLKGVSWSRKARSWRASIGVDKSTLCLGHFESPYEAHLMYRRAALHFYGEFARV